MWEKACAEQALAGVGARLFSHAGGRIGLFRTEQGLFAVANTCPHYDADLHMGELRGDKVLCPWHRWRFDLKTGHCDTGARFDLCTYPVKVEAGFIWVDVAAGEILPR